MTESEAKSLKAEYLQPENRLRVRKYLIPPEGGKSGIYAYEKDNLSSSLFYGAKGVQNGKLGNIIYIPAVSRLEEQTKLSGPSPLRDLLNNIFSELAQASPAYRKLQNNFETFTQEFKAEKNQNNRSVEGLEREVNEMIGSWQLGFDLQIKPPQEADFIKNLIDYEITDKKLGEPVNPQQLGQGFNRHLIFSLIRLSAEYKVSKEATPTTKKDFTPDLSLLLFEEPEAFLHPSQQEELCRYLKKIAQTETEQVLLSSHSTRFVSQNTDAIPSIIRLSKPNKKHNFWSDYQSHAKQRFR